MNREAAAGFKTLTSKHEVWIAHHRQEAKQSPQSHVQQDRPIVPLQELLS